MAGPSAAGFSAITNLLQVLLEDRNMDAVFLLAPVVMDKTLLASRMGLDAEQIKAYREKEEKNIELIREKAEKYGKLVFVMWQSRDINPDPEIASILRKGNIIIQSNARRAARVMRHLVWYRRYLDAAADK